MDAIRTEPDSGRLLEATMTWREDAPVTAGGGGRLALLLPVYNCRPLLERHAETLRECLDLVDEVVIVDSDSADGSGSFLARHLDHPCLRLVHHPRGLYASWNAGLALIRAERVLIATAGDRMPRQNLAHLLEVAETADADVALSPPRMYDAHGAPAPNREIWPIHQILRWHPHDTPFVPAPGQMASWAMHFAGLGAGMLGSSASNLYRTKMLQRHPFPLDCGPAGDVAWGIHHLARATSVITPRRCADFILHDRTPESETSHARIRRQLAHHAVRALDADNTSLTSWMSRLDRYRDREEKFQNHLRNLRKNRKPPGCSTLLGGGRNTPAMPTGGASGTWPCLRTPPIPSLTSGAPAPSRRQVTGEQMRSSLNPPSA